MRAHQFLTFTTPPNLQWAVAEGLRGELDWVEQSRAGFERSRDRLATGLDRLGLRTLPSQATWFIALDLAASGIALDDEAFCDWLVDEAGVAGLPISGFYVDQPVTHLVRLCFAKEDATLDEALARLERALPTLPR
jgi:aspartate/methionine/tyrosine aminotransferase